MDYQILLIKYIGHIIEREGESFIDVVRIKESAKKKSPLFSVEEVAELEKLELAAHRSFKTK